MKNEYFSYNLEQKEATTYQSHSQTFRNYAIGVSVIASTVRLIIS
ncbi:hypothetical protein STAPHY8AQ_110053 [Staphylococcus sp. 8AQ]|nr:hypothetical protein STAPHY8AQ_110053 [Staphylococcus sp. 8AQ]